METDLMLTNIPATEIGVDSAIQMIERSTLVQNLIGKVAGIKEVSKKIRVRNDEDEKLAIDSIGAIRSVAKTVEEYRTQLISAPTLFIRMANGKFKPLIDELDDAKSKITVELSKYQYNKKVEQDRAQKKAQADLDKLRTRVEKNGGDASVLPVKAPEIVEQRTVRGGAATSYVKPKTEFVVDNFMLLVKAVAAGKEKPEALLVNEPFIRALIKAGVREIPGVSIHTTEQTIIRSRP